jgi:hypothetical protein
VRYRPPSFRVLLAIIAIVAVTLGACARGDEGSGIPGAAALVEDPFAGGYPLYEDAASGLQVVFGTPDIAVGQPRVSFAVFHNWSVIDVPVLTVRTFRYPDGPQGDRLGPLEEATLLYGPFPFGGRGVYRGPLVLSGPGLWAIEAVVPLPGGSERTILFPIDVAVESRAPAIGALAPRSAHRTLADAPYEELTTAWEPVEALYRVTIAEAHDLGRPFVVVFASPAYCTTALCGPQVELVGELAEDYGDVATFIHVDLYENPHEIQGDLSRARRSPVLAEWGVVTDQWTFVVGTDGRIVARFEGFAPRDELEASLLQALGR